MDTKKHQKTSKNIDLFYCESCDFKCSKKGDWDRHTLRDKHVFNLKGYNDTKKDTQKTSKNIKPYSCGCGNIYHYHSGLWRHQQKCKHIALNDDDTSAQENLILSNLILEIVKQNKELMKENIEFKDIMMDLAKNAGNNTMINNNTNNSHNKTFNLQFFLNETCKDAMNIMDFVDSLKLQLCDLERIGEVGFVTGISDIIIKNLKALDVSKRPVHCADTKREVMYVKDNDKWEKEQNDNQKLKKAIKHIAKKNSMNINLFKDKYPDCINSHSRKSDQFNKIYIEAYGGSGNQDVDNENKIIKNIAKVVFIDKN
jgi:hypothetical protein